MTNLFNVLPTANNGALGKTQQLTTICEGIAKDIFAAISSEVDKLAVEKAKLNVELIAAVDEDAKSLIAAQIADNESDAKSILDAIENSKTAHNNMDELIAAWSDLHTVDVEFLKVESDDVLDKMIKSQQSKRSRAKAKAMTQENYNTMMVGAIAENILRLASGKTKAGHNGSANSKPVEYTSEVLEAYTNDKEKLNKEIRNIQSKKSIMKSKAGFDIQSEQYLILLDAEQMLKGMRDGFKTATVNVEVVPAYVPQLLEAKKLVDEEVDGIDLTKIKLADAKDLLMRINSLMSLVELPKAEEEQPINDAE